MDKRVAEYVMLNVLRWTVRSPIAVMERLMVMKSVMMVIMMNMMTAQTLVRLMVYVKTLVSQVSTASARMVAANPLRGNVTMEVTVLTVVQEETMPVENIQCWENVTTLWKDIIIVLREVAILGAMLNTQVVMNIENVLTT